ncbi:septum formation protein Maf [Thiohalorhabdus denitrificans]|uniref:dTTP/UTP pyrophosphatase n=1 Tax=Thiohalorhabdus denitrificans TaxID=381306 RepID=A0A0P9C8N8_9GAMM|nr:Maf family protein [Thiohalorhabdus denitrificans]KPV39552.1 septum formation protein Maf [Thiohalorhabdus denitrificans]SCX98911.1 septum formation protein [Thiohalorhabdus denitrificans]
MTDPVPLYLASRSPRRAELLEQIGIPHRPVESSVDETPRAGEAPASYVERLARDKAAAGAATVGLPDRKGALVLGADTAIEQDGSILGKPGGPGDARRYLQSLSGREHEVLSAVAVTDGRRTESRLNRTRVRVRPLEAAEIEAYIETGEPMDKAGAYAIQGRGAVFVEEITGSYSAVMGLPLCETDQLLRGFGAGTL